MTKLMFLSSLFLVIMTYSCIESRQQDPASPLAMPGMVISAEQRSCRKQIQHEYKSSSDKSCPNCGQRGSAFHKCPATPQSSHHSVQATKQLLKDLCLLQERNAK